MINLPPIFTIAFNASTILGLLALLSALYAWVHLSTQERSLAQEITGPSIIASKEVIRILKMYKDDSSRTQALGHLLSAEHEGREQLLKRIRPTLQKWNDAERLEDRRNRLLMTGAVLVLIGVLGAWADSNASRGESERTPSASEPVAVLLPLRSVETQLSMERLREDLVERGLFGWQLNPTGGLVDGELSTTLVRTPYIGLLFVLLEEDGASFSFPAGLAIVPPDGKVLTIQADLAPRDSIPGLLRTEFNDQLRVVVEFEGQPASYERLQAVVNDSTIGNSVRVRVSSVESVSGQRVLEDREVSVDAMPVTLVEDRKTDLSWMIPPIGDQQLSYNNAYILRRAANTVHLGGHRDWRLPTVEEALSLMRDGKQGQEPRLSDTFALVPWTCWTSDTLLLSNGEKGQKLVVDFHNGAVETQFRAGLRLVRSASAPETEDDQHLDRGRRLEPKSYTTDCHFQRMLPSNFFASPEATSSAFMPFNGSLPPRRPACSYPGSGD